MIILFPPILHLELLVQEVLLHQLHQQYRQIQKYTGRVDNLTKEREHFELFQRRQITSRLKVLEDLGYIEANGLMPRGEIAAQISGYEMQISQLLFVGFFEKLGTDEINILMMAIVAEQRKDSGRFRKLHDNRLKHILRSADREIESLRAVEALHGVAEITPKFETKLSAVMLAWSRGCEFEELHNYADLADGDFVRSFRLVIDFLRQTRRAMAGHSALLDKLDRCIKKITQIK